MVSFQCHNCGDVVKKPKLDQHRLRCHGGFDCIDCSTAFHSPAEYRLHTSCISEAEKYQKSLYKGPKSGIGKRNDSEKNQQYGNYNRNYRNGFHEYGARGCGKPSWGAPRSQVTGANDTPLGTPVRMSPVPRPVEVEEEKAAGVGHGAAQMETLAKQKKDKKDKKEKDKGSKREKDEKDEKGARKEKDTKDRKRKAEDEGTRDDARSSKKKTKVEEQIVDPLLPVKKDVKEEKEKDRKKKGKEKKQKANEMKEEEMESMAEGREAKEKRKKQRIGETMASETLITANVDVDMASPEDTSNNDGKNQNSKNKKKKKNKQKISAERDEDQAEEVTGSVEA